MQETKETLPEWIEREAHAALHRFTNSAGSTVDGLRAVIAPYIEAVDAAQRRSRELEAWLLKTDGEPIAERVEREKWVALNRYNNFNGNTVESLGFVVAPLVEGHVVLENRVRELEAKVTACADERRELLEDLDKLGSDLAEQRDHSRKLEATIAETRTVERTEFDATWAAYEVEKSRVRFFDALSIDSSNHGLAVALPMAMKPLLDIVVSTNADRNRLRSENLRLARDAVAAREREEASRAECAAHDARLADCQRELARQKDNVERLASDAGKFSHKWTALLNERDAALAEVASRGIYITNLEARITYSDQQIARLIDDAKARNAARDNTLNQASYRAEHFEREATRLRANVERLVARVKTFDEKWAQQASELHTERAEHEATRDKLAHATADILAWSQRYTEEARKRAAAEMAIHAAECAALDERKAHVATKARLDAADFNKGVCGKRFDDERAAHDTTKAELAAARERLVHYEAELRRWIGMRDEEARRREAAEMALNAHAETIGVLEAKLEDIRKAYANERAEHASTKSHDAAGALHVAAARAEAIAERERAEEYLATVNGLLRRERERTEVQS